MKTKYYILLPTDLEEGVLSVGEFPSKELAKIFLDLNHKAIFKYLQWYKETHHPSVVINLIPAVKNLKQFTELCKITDEIRLPILKYDSLPKPKKQTSAKEKLLNFIKPQDSKPKEVRKPIERKIDRKRILEAFKDDFNSYYIVLSFHVNGVPPINYSIFSNRYTPIDREIIGPFNSPTQAKETAKKYKLQNLSEAYRTDIVRSHGDVDCRSLSNYLKTECGNKLKTIKRNKQLDELNLKIKRGGFKCLDMTKLSRTIQGRLTVSFDGSCKDLDLLEKLLRTIVKEY